MLRSAFLGVFIISVSGHVFEHKYGYEYHPVAGGWLRMNIVPAIWYDAALRCNFEGGRLASPMSGDMASAMVSIMAKNGNTSHVYTGIDAHISRGDFMTIEGVPVSNLSLGWAAGEPNNDHNAESCVVMSRAGELADVDCSRLFRYFCFKTSVMMSTSTTCCGTWDSSYKLDSRTGSCYKFHTLPRTWNRAAEACHAEQAHLAVINSETEAQVLKELLNSHPQEENKQENRDFAFIGIWDKLRQGEWRTIFDQTLKDAGYAKWATTQPDNRKGIEYLGAIDRSGHLHDVPRDMKSVFICEIQITK